MHFLELLAEQRLKEAIERGDFDELPGCGKPLPEEDINPFIPVENRAAYRVLKNAGYLPPELLYGRQKVLALAGICWQQQRNNCLAERRCRSWASL